jgi:hypothetical protein
LVFFAFVGSGAETDGKGAVTICSTGVESTLLVLDDLAIILFLNKLFLSDLTQIYILLRD